MTGVVNPKTSFTYDPPTKNTDGSDLALSDIAKFEVGFGTVAGTYTLVKEDTVIETGKQVSPIALAAGLAYGQWYCAVRAVSKAGQTSAWSTPPVPFELQAPTPNPPSNFSVA